jgi:hypothetical protein
MEGYIMAYNKNGKKQQNTNNIEVPINFEGIDDSIKNEIIDVLKSTPFNKISFNVGSFRRLLDDKISKDDTRVIAVGYIKKFIEDKNSFVVGLYAANKDTILKFKNPTIDIIFKDFDGKLGTILKINIVPEE